MYAQPGSGVFFNVGRTIHFESHAQAVQHFLPTAMSTHRHNSPTAMSFPLV